jgi:hypothetical protein
MKLDTTWESQLLAASMSRENADLGVFLDLVDQSAGRVSLQVARVLMKTFSDKPDYGSQERVVGVLATAAPEVALQAELEELPRLLLEAPEWAEALIGEEVEHRPGLLRKVARKLSPTIQASLRQLLTQPEFAEFFPNAKSCLP